MDRHRRATIRRAAVALVQAGRALLGRGPPLLAALVGHPAAGTSWGRLEPLAGTCPPSHPVNGLVGAHRYYVPSHPS